MTTANALKPHALTTWLELMQSLRLIHEGGGSTPCTRDPEPFTSESFAERREAAEACTGCPALAACRSYADANDEPAHVWAGVDRTKRAAK